ncbi:MAG: flagellar FliJ family protein [Oscillospiraceae bacterium]|nr:flagellar FliJ family protein [Oscillospiraceae bacterium]
MKKFEFSLERIRNYKTQILDKEKKTLGNLNRRKDEIVDRIHSLENFRDEKTEQLTRRQIEGVSMMELVSLNYLIESTRKQIDALLIELERAEEIAEAQRKVVVSIYQEKTGMDKLEEKQLEEYRLLEAKTNEGELMQAITNGMARKNLA